MKIAICFFMFLVFFVPLIGVSAGQGGDSERGVVTLTALQVRSAVDIEAAIQQATAQGTRPGTVLLDGKKGVFVLSGPDRSVNIFVSNLILRGINNPVIQGCADGLFFDDFPLVHIRVENITFVCDANGIVASGAFKDVTVRNNLFRAASYGIGLGGASSGWLITGNVIQSGADAVRIHGAERVVITNNHLMGTIGVALFGCTTFQVRRNTITASHQGVLLAQESWDNMVQLNTITGVSAAGIALEPGAVRNRLLANSALCAGREICPTVDATEQTARANTLRDNRP